MRVREPLSITEQLQHATELHQQGQLGDAERVYMQILRMEARQFIALHGWRFSLYSKVGSKRHCSG